MESIHFMIPHSRHSFNPIHREKTCSQTLFVGVYIEFKHRKKAQDELSQGIS
jgi:hypothetical protein